MLVKFLLLLFPLFPLHTSAQIFPVDALSSKIYYTEEVLVKDGPQFDLYNRAKAWFAAGKNKRNLQVDDLANGLIIGCNYQELSVANGQKIQTFRLWYTVKLELEDDRYWYSLTDFRLQGRHLPKEASVKTPESEVPLEALVLAKNGARPNGENGIFYKSLQNAAHKSILALIKDLKANML